MLKLSKPSGIFRQSAAEPRTGVTAGSTGAADAAGAARAPRERVIAVAASTFAILVDIWDVLWLSDDHTDLVVIFLDCPPM